MQEAFVKDNIDISADAFDMIRATLKSAKGFNLDIYKDKCIRRRIAIRIRATHCRTAEEYGDLLRQNPLESDLLLKVLTIHVSQFFRNPSMFEKLRSRILPELFRTCSRNDSGVMRILCLGCAGGEEPYSLAILLREHFSAEMRSVPTSITGCDIDDETLRMARQADYTEDRIKEVPVVLRERYFRREGSRFQLVPELREAVSFHHGNVTSVAEHQPSDLVLCRNTLIYFTRSDQEKILHGIADILPENGIVVLGKSETLVGDVRRRFTSVCPVERIYCKVKPDSDRSNIWQTDYHPKSIKEE